ncbi:hypothetical protein ECNE1487_1339, partial [Escherichia coli NE1487]
MFSIVALLS